MAAEIERKYAVPVDFALDPGLTAAGATFGEPVVHELAAVYYDTADLRLAAGRVALRRRTGGTDAGWHVKRYRGDEDRDEVQLPLGRGAAVPAAVGAEVGAVTRGGTLRPTVRITTRRTEWPLLSPDGKTVAYSQPGGGIYKVSLAGGISGQVVGSGSNPSFSARWKRTSF